MKKPRYVHGYIDRHGRPRFYFRRAGFKKVPLSGLPWSPDFMAAYDAALAGSAPTIEIGAGKTIPGTINAAIVRYLQSSAFSAFSPGTQAMRRAVLERFRKEHGDKRIRMLGTNHIARLLAKQKPFAQRNTLKTLRGLMTFALADGLIATDPTAGYKPPKVKDKGGFLVWSEDQIAAFREHHALGSRPRLALELLINTGQRRSDVVRMGRQHIRNGILSIRQQKTGNQIEIPVLPELRQALDAMPENEHLTFLTTERGKSFTAASFGMWFRDQCDAVGRSDAQATGSIPKGYAAHGLRKAAATRHANAGATAHELMAWFGWTSISEAQRYTKAADRKRLAQGMVTKLKGGTQIG